MSKIYIVISSAGEYEDYRVWNEKAFTKREDAEAYAKVLDEEHHKRPSFITDEFICLLRECEEKLPDWEEFPEAKITSENKEKWLQWQVEQQNEQEKHLFRLMHEQGQFITKEMYDQYEEWESDSYINWHKCRIEELELV